MDRYSSARRDAVVLGTIPLRELSLDDPIDLEILISTAEIAPAPYNDYPDGPYKSADEVAQVMTGFVTRYPDRVQEAFSAGLIPRTPIWAAVLKDRGYYRLFIADDGYYAHLVATWHATGLPKRERARLLRELTVHPDKATDHIIEALGEFGDTDCLSVLERFAAEHGSDYHEKVEAAVVDIHSGQAQALALIDQLAKPLPPDFGKRERLLLERHLDIVGSKLADLPAERMPEGAAELVLRNDPDHTVALRFVCSDNWKLQTVAIDALLKDNVGGKAALLSSPEALRVVKGWATERPGQCDAWILYQRVAPGEIPFQHRVYSKPADHTPTRQPRKGLIQNIGKAIGWIFWIVIVNLLGPGWFAALVVASSALIGLSAGFLLVVGIRVKHFQEVLWIGLFGILASAVSLLLASHVDRTVWALMIVAIEIVFEWKQVSLRAKASAHISQGSTKS